MAKRPTIASVAAGFASNTVLNSNFEVLRNGFDNTLSRDGSTPNEMNASLDMNNQDILNAKSLTIAGVDVFTLVNKITVSTADPSGGADGDIWFKVNS